MKKKTAPAKTTRPPSPIADYISKEVSFRFRGIDFSFALSHGLFSSNDIDMGTRLLLRVLSQAWDGDSAEGRPLPCRVLDSGCGAGIIGICAARALGELHVGAAGFADAARPEHPPPCFVRAQDRDELARLFTAYNAEKNSPPAKAFPPFSLEAHTEPLLASPAGCFWDLILTNIPAKAGEPVLEDFVRRSVELLAPGGRVFMVAVNTLGGFFRSLINENGALEREESGREHTVFVYRRQPPPSAVHPPKAAGDGATGQGGASCGPVTGGEHFVRDNPFYLRGSGDYEMEGTAYHIDAVHGAAEFDRPGGAAAAAAKLVSRLGIEKMFPPPKEARDEAPSVPLAPVLLIHEGGQGHFPVWLLRHGPLFFKPKKLILSGRNILALEAARHNVISALAAQAGPGAGSTETEGTQVLAIPRTELPEGQLDSPCDLIAVFPETVPLADRMGALWEDLARMLRPGGNALIALPSSEAEKFDRKKTEGFTRMGDIKRQGFRALAYRRVY